MGQLADKFRIRNRIRQFILHQAQARVKIGNNRHYHCESTHNHEHQANATTWTYTDELSDASGQGTIRDHQARVARIGRKKGEAGVRSCINTFAFRGTSSGKGF